LTVLDKVEPGTDKIDDNNPKNNTENPNGFGSNMTIGANVGVSYEKLNNDSNWITLSQGNEKNDPNKVGELQSKLITLDFLKLKDAKPSVYDKHTYEAVKSFQTKYKNKYNLNCTGNVDKKTMDAINIEYQKKLDKIKNDKGTGKAQLKEWTFNGKAFMIGAEGNYDYIYSTQDNSTPRTKWTGKFNSNKDLTFGIGHKVEDAAEYNKILNEIKGKSHNEIQNIVNTYYEKEIKKFVDATNNFVKKNKIYLTQNQFDAVVMLIYNNGEALLDKNSTKYYDKDLCSELLKYSGNPNPTYAESAIIKGFTYTKVNGVRKPGLVKRSNNEINLFLNNGYNYYEEPELISNGLDYIKF
jgi:GH24 family phage-related lysozyme (muramidase)